MNDKQIEENPLNRNISKKRHFCLVGYRGAGKSFLAEKIREQFFSQKNSHFVKMMPPLFFSLDELCEEYLRDSILHAVKEKGWSFFRQVEKNQLKSIMQSKDTIFLDCGGGIVEDRENRAIIQKRSWVVFLDISMDELVRRQLKKPRPLLDNGLQEENIVELVKKETEINLAKRLPLYKECADLIISDVDKKKIEIVFSFILEKIQKNIF